MLLVKQKIDAVSKTHYASKEDLIEILDSTQDDYLFKAADQICRENFGNIVKVRAILEFSNYCRRQCRYCGLNCINSHCQRYRMSPEEIVSTAYEAYQAGYQTIVLQSGEDPYYTKEKICLFVKEIKKVCPNMAVTLSLGERSAEEYKAFRQAGADRYLIKQEVADPEIYKALHPDSSLSQRVDCLKALKSLGYETGSGFMIGLPGQTTKTLAEDLLLLQKIPCDMAGIGPFIPHPQTPLKNVKNNPFRLSLKVIAILRLLLPDINIPATTAMEALHPNGRILALQCGANVIMPNVTNLEFCKSYQLYPGKPLPFDSLEIQYNKISKMLTTLGRTIATDFGFHQKF